MSATALTILTVLLALVVVAVLAAALIVVRERLASAAGTLATLAAALEMVESEHLRSLEPSVQAINAQFETIVAAFPPIAAKAKVVAERRPR